MSAEKLLSDASKAMSVVSAAKSAVGSEFFSKLFGKSSEQKLKEILGDFLSNENTRTLAHEMLSVADSILGYDVDKIAQVNPSDFAISKLDTICHIGSVDLEPRCVYAGIQQLFVDAFNTGNIKENYFGLKLNNFAHLILGIAIMAGHVFVIQDTKKQIDWLETLKVFLQKIKGSELVRDMGKNREHFLHFIRQFEKKIDLGQDTIRRREEVRSIRDIIGVIYQNTIGVVEYMKRIIPAFGTEKGWWNSGIPNGTRFGVPTVKDAENNFNLVTIMLDCLGLTQPLVESDIQLKHNEAILTLKTLKIMQDLFKLPPSNNAVLPDLIEYLQHHGILEKNKLSNLTAQFLAKLSELAKRKDDPTLPKIYLERDGSLHLQFLHKNEKIDRLLINSGIDQKYLAISEKKSKDIKSANPASLEKRCQEYLKLILEVEIGKTRLSNAINSFWILCAKSKDLFQHYGDVGGALFLQQIFPAMKILLNSALKDQKGMDDKIKFLQDHNIEVDALVSRFATSFRGISEALTSIQINIAKGQSQIERVLHHVACGEMTLIGDIQVVINSLETCGQLFTLSKLLSEQEQSDLKENIKSIKNHSSEAKLIDNHLKRIAQQHIKNEHSASKEEILSSKNEGSNPDLALGKASSPQQSISHSNIASNMRQNSKSDVTSFSQTKKLRNTSFFKSSMKQKNLTSTEENRRNELFNFSLELLRLGDLESRIEALEVTTSLRDQKEEPRVVFLLATIQHSLGELSSAKKTLEELFELEVSTGNKKKSPDATELYTKIVEELSQASTSFHS